MKTLKEWLLRFLRSNKESNHYEPFKHYVKSCMRCGKSFDKIITIYNREYLVCKQCAKVKVNELNTKP